MQMQWQILDIQYRYYRIVIIRDSKGCTINQYILYDRLVITAIFVQKFRDFPKTCLFLDVLSISRVLRHLFKFNCLIFFCVLSFFPLTCLTVFLTKIPLHLWFIWSLLRLVIHWLSLVTLLLLGKRSNIAVKSLMSNHYYT